MDPQQRRRARLIQGVLIGGGILLSLAYWWSTFDGCSFGFGCW